MSALLEPKVYAQRIWCDGDAIDDGMMDVPLNTTSTRPQPSSTERWRNAHHHYAHTQKLASRGADLQSVAREAISKHEEMVPSPPCHSSS